MRLLLADDEPAMAAANHRFLTKRGNIVDHVPTIEQAREALKMGVHETFLLDRQLPDGDGITLLSEMRRNADTTPVILADRA